MTEILLRIKDFYLSKGLTARSFALSIGFSYSTLNNYMLGKRATIDAELISKTLSTYDDMSAEWLLRGNGPMILAPSEDVSSISITKLLSVIETMQDTIDAKKARIQELEEANARLQSELSSSKKII